jgi:hypothetical protein
VLSGDDATIGRALARGIGVSKAVMSIPQLADQCKVAQSEIIKRELKDLCSSKSPSVLRGKDPESLLSFSWKKMHEELTLRAPTFYGVLKSVCENKEEKMKSELPAILSAASILITSYSREMSAVAFINSIVLLKGGAKKSTFTRLNAVKTCMSYKATLEKADEVANLEEENMAEWRKTVWSEQQSERSLLSDIKTLKSSVDNVSILLRSSFENQLTALRARMHPGYYFVGDNVDMRTHVRHHRLHHTDLDAHMFQTAAYKNRVPANHLDPLQPLGDIRSAPFSDVLPTPQDFDQLKSNMAVLVATTWTKYLEPFKSCNIPERKHKYSHCTKRKTERVSLGVLNKCENKSDEMLDICEEVHKHVPGHEDSEDINHQPIRTAFEGDYLTFERIKASQSAKRNGRTPSKQLSGLLARTAEFHNQAELMKAIWYHLYSQDTATDKGTLYNVKSQLGASNVGDEPFKNYYASADLLDRYTIAYVVLGGMKHFGMSSKSSDTTQNMVDGILDFDFLTAQAAIFVEEFVQLKGINTNQDAPRSVQLVCRYCKKVFKSRISALVAHEVEVHGHQLTEEEDDNSHQEQDPIYNYTCKTLTLCLLRWEHNDAIQYADGDRISLVDKYLLLVYKVSKCPKYAFAMLETSCQIKILLSARDSFLFTWNRTVNHRGELDTNFPNDQDLEHQNALFKSEAKTYRGKFTERTLKRVSKSAQITDAIVKNYDRSTHVFRPSGRHKMPDWSDDIDKLVTSMKSSDVFANKPGSRLRKGLNTLSPDILSELKVSKVKGWLKSSFTQFARKHYYQY